MLIKHKLRNTFIIKTILAQDLRTTQALKQISYSFAYKAISIGVGLAYVPLLLHYLNSEKYGVWLTLTSILGWFSFFDIGLGNGLRNKLSEAIAKNNYSLGRKYVSTTYALLIIIFGVLLIVFHVINPFLKWSSILNTTRIDTNDLYLLTSVVFSFFLIRFIVQLISIVYFADQKPSITNVITTLGQIVSFIIVWFLVKFSQNQDLVLLGSIISAVPVFIFIGVSIIAFSNKYKYLAPNIRQIDFTYTKDLLNVGFKFFFLQICYIIVFSTSNFFIAQLYGPDEVAIYNVAYKYFQIPVMVYSIILSPLWSSVTNAYVLKDYKWLKKTIKQANIVSIIFSFGVIVMQVISQWVFKLWVGNKVIVPVDLCIMLSVFTIIQIFLSPYSHFINGTGILKLTTSLTAFGIVLYIVLIFVFGNIFSNSSGVVLAIIFTSLIGAIIQPWQTHKILQLKAKGIWIK